MQTQIGNHNFGDAQYEYVFDRSLKTITGKDVIAHLNPLRSKPRVFCLSLTGLNLVFPVKEVDKYLKRIDKIGRRIFNLTLTFDPVNSVEMLDMVVARFPHTQQLFMRYSQEHPVEHALKCWSQLPNLFNMDLPFPVQDVAKSMQTNKFTSMPNMQILKCQVSLFDDEYSHYEATLPVLFPNLKKLVVACAGQVLEDIEANIRTVLPKLDLVQTFDIGPPEDEIWNPEKGDIFQTDYELIAN